MQKTRRTNPFTASMQELKSVRCIALTALLISLNVTMDLLNIRIWLTPELRVGIGFVLNASIAMLFGPAVGMMAGFCTDVLGYMANPVGGAYFPGYTLTAIVGGLIYGLWLYQRKPSRARVFGAKACINLVCNVGLNTLWLSMTGGSAMLALLPARLAKNVLLLPVEAILLYLAVNLVADLHGRLTRPAAVPLAGAKPDR